jgi:release factor glutamine methyltransferase
MNEPAAYLAGFILFRGRRFKMDRRAYITDPELSHLIDAVAGEAQLLERTLGRPPRLLEFGVGAGTLALTLKLEHPQWDISGLDIDARALELARENAEGVGQAIPLLQSDYFSAWPPEAPAPDLIFGDPPWGGPADLYDEVRDAHYYEQMPVLSAFPGGESPCGIHDELIRRVRLLGWPTMLVLNYGVLPLAVIELSASPLTTWRVHKPQPHLSILIGNAEER